MVDDFCGRLNIKRTICVMALIILMWGPCGQCCGPGRGRGRRRSPRKLAPLVYKQHVPNVAENTLGASGLIEGRISRDDLRFNELVPNYNADILFADEEGTGADRIMTERCKERLNTLAISVMNHWPGVRLRVTEAWDESSMHAPNSLHYEGRAVDISTSDKDFSKQGMLARLAVQSGFDWVYYESRSRVHCSVKSESSARKRLGGCFPGNAKVYTTDGTISLKDLREGDFVKVLKDDGSVSFSPVLLFLHKDPLGARNFLALSTASGTVLHLTPSHLVFILRREEFEKMSNVPIDSHSLMNHGTVVLAGAVNPGDYLLTVDSQTQKLSTERVVDMTSYRGFGVFAPLTAEGTVVVNDVVTSCYAVIDSQKIAHWAFLPVRLYSKFKEAVWWVLSYVWLGQDAPNQQEFRKSLNKPFAGSESNITTTILLISRNSIKNIDSSSLLSHRIRNIDDTLSKKNNITKKVLLKYRRNYNRIGKYISSKIYRKDIDIPSNNVNYKAKSIGKNRNKVFVNGQPPFITTKFSNTSSKHTKESDHIHWYPKMLYYIASWILPSHLVYS